MFGNFYETRCSLYYSLEVGVFIYLGVGSKAYLLETLVFLWVKENYAFQKNMLKWELLMKSLSDTFT